jgi:hypothetical protein
MDASSSIKLIPCGHSQFCGCCAHKVILNYEPCPLCRENITHYEIGGVANNAQSFRIRAFAIDFALNEDYTAVLEWNFVKQNIVGLVMLYITGALRMLKTASFERQILADVLRDVQNNWEQIKTYALQHASGVPIFEMTCHNDKCRARFNSQ